MTERKRASLLYLGGSDSTLAAVELNKEFDLIHLLTFKIGKSHLFTKSWPIHSANELCKIMGDDKFVHRYMNMKHLHKTLVSGHLIENYRKYRYLCLFGVEGAKWRCTLKRLYIILRIISNTLQME